MPSNKLLNAVCDLTRTDRREEKPSRYELTAPARDACWQLLGPPPEKDEAFWTHPDGSPMERPQKEAQAEPEKKARKPRGRGR